MNVVQPAAGARELSLDVGGLRLAAKAWGPADGLPVVALHGWLDNAASFDHLAPLLPGVRLVGVDLPGHGHSQHRPVGASYHLIDWLADLDGILDALEWPKAVLMGHSLGAAICSMYAGAVPERVQSLVLLDGLGPLSAAATAAPDCLRAHLRDRRRQRERQQVVYPDAQAAAQRLRQVVGELSEKAAVALVGRGLVSDNGTGVRWRSDPRLRGRSAWRLSEDQVQAFLRRVACPTWLLWAEDGYPFDRQLMLERQALIAELHVERMTGGHHVHLDRAPEIAELVMPFLRQTGAL